MPAVTNRELGSYRAVGCGGAFGALHHRAGVVAGLELRLAAIALDDDLEVVLAARWQHGVVLPQHRELADGLALATTYPDDRLRHGLRCQARVPVLAVVQPMPGVEP